MDFKKKKAVLFWEHLEQQEAGWLTARSFCFVLRTQRLRVSHWLRKRWIICPSPETSDKVSQLLPKPTGKCIFSRTLNKTTVNHHQSPHGETNHQKANNKQYFKKRKHSVDLTIEPRTSNMPAKHSIVELNLQPSKIFILFIYFEAWTPNLST